MAIVGENPIRGRLSAPPRRGCRIDPALELEMPATAGACAVAHATCEPLLAAHLEACQAPALLADALLALDEAISNVVRHAYPEAAGEGIVRLRVELSPWLIRFVIEDEGPGFDLAAIPPPDFERPVPGGYGLHLMRATMSRVSTRRIGGRNELVLEKAITRDARP